MERDDFGLAKLIEKSRQLTSHTEDQTFFLRRNIDQIEQQARTLAQRPTRTVDQQSVNRAYPLTPILVLFCYFLLYCVDFVNYISLVLIVGLAMSSWPRKASTRSAS